MSNADKFVELTVQIGYFADQMEFKTGEVRQAFYASLGRMLAYQMENEQAGRRLVTMGINKDRDGCLELTAAYYRPLPTREYDSQYYGTVDQVMTDAIQKFSTEASALGHVFVMGGIPRDGGKTYSFHS